jgi:HSP20 family molecular chaperone IbpA
MLDVEQAIREVGTIYQGLTGRAIEAGQAELPPDVDAHQYIQGRYRQLKSILESPRAAAAASPSAPAAPAWSPALEVVELEHEVRYEIDLPAVTRDQVSVAVTGEWLVVRGLRAPAKDAAVRYSERASGPFQRTVALPPRARKGGIQAAMRDGVLVVTVPTEGPSAAPQPIEVK